MSFTAKDILNTVILIGKNNPYFVYIEQEGYDSTETCGYAGRNLGETEGSPCIVGKALQDHGVPVDVLQWESRGARFVVEDFAKEEDGVPDTETLLILREIQEAQDDGKSWGEAVRSGSPL